MDPGGDPGKVPIKVSGGAPRGRLLACMEGALAGGSRITPKDLDLAPGAGR